MASAPAKRGLGKGLGALIPSTPEAQAAQATDISAPGVVPGAVYAELPIGSIEPNPRQPRSVFDPDALAELVYSIREIGLLQPVVVREAGNHYELIAGERRLRASKEAGLTHIPAIIRATDDDDLLRDALLENLHPWLDMLVDKYRLELQNDRRELIRRYRVVDFGHKVVGVGSVGLRAFVLLLQGRDENDLLVLQAKEAVQSVLEPYTQSCVYEHQGERVVEGQRLMQAASDAFLGWVQAPNGRQFYLRQLRDMKWSPDIAKLPMAQLSAYASLCGRTLAHGHARSGDPVAIAAYLGQSAKFDNAMSSFARAYSSQVASDFAEYSAAIADGRVVTGEVDFSGDRILERRQNIDD